MISLLSGYTRLQNDAVTSCIDRLINAMQLRVDTHYYAEDKQ